MGSIIEAVFLVGLIVLLISVYAAYRENAIRLSIFARRREIEVMALVGATNWFVRGPFMIEGLLCRLIGSVAAIVLLLIGKQIVPLPNWRRQLGHPGARFRADRALVILAAGLLLGAVGSALTLHQFLRV